MNGRELDLSVRIIEAARAILLMLELNVDNDVEANTALAFVYAAHCRLLGMRDDDAIRRGFEAMLRATDASVTKFVDEWARVFARARDTN